MARLSLHKKSLSVLPSMECYNIACVLGSQENLYYMFLTLSKLTFVFEQSSQKISQKQKRLNH